MKIKKTFLVFIVFLIFNLVCIKCEFKIKSSTIKQKSTGVLDGANINFGYIDVELDDDLYRYDPLGCPNFNCTSLAEDGDCTCDYTDMNECPRSFTNSKCINQCPEFATDSITPMCGNNKWATLTVGQEQHIFTSINGETMYFRYKANSKICQGILAVSYPIVGYFKGGIGSSPINQRELPSVNVQTYNIINICPTDNQPFSSHLSWTTDTYYITIVPVSEGNVTFSLRIQSGEIPPTPTTPITACTKNLSTHECLTDGESYRGYIDGPTYQYFTFQVTKPAYYILSAPRLEQDINIVISDDPKNIRPVFNHQPKWELAEESDDYVLIYFDQPTLLYIGLYCSYKTNYSFSMTSQGSYFSTKITSLPTNSGAYALTKSSRLILPDGSALSCPTWYLCSNLVNQYPLEDGNPLWPVPPYFLESPSYNSINYEDVFLANPIKPNSYQLSVILSLKTVSSLSTKIYYSIDVISKSSIEFLSTLFNSKGEPLRGITPIKQVELSTCNYTEFQSILSAIEKTQSILFSVTDLNSLNNWRYRLEALTIRDDWVGCSNQASSLLNTQIVSKNVTTTSCPYGLSNKDKSIDPCCNGSLSFFQCCIPKISPVSTIEFINTLDDKIEDQCSSFECTQSVLSEYYKSLSTSDDCTVPDYITRDLKLSVVETVRTCKVPNKILCDNDNDCKNSTGTKCDLFSRYCIPNIENTDKIYINCVLRNLSPSALYAFAQISPTSINDSLVESIYNQHIQDDCVSESFIDSDILRNSMVYNSTSIKFGRCYPPIVCLDSSCVLQHDICYDRFYTNYQEYQYPPIEFSCTKYGFCQVPVCNGPTDFKDSCAQTCNSISSFCGHCSSENQTFCHALNDFTDKATCTSSSACLLPNGRYQLGVTKEQCENLGECSNDCGFECTGFKGCIIESSHNQTDCLTHTGSVWNTNYEICTFTTNSQVNCSSSSYTWVDCPSNSPDECFGTTCSVYTIPCQTKDSCINDGGKCSDQYFFSQDSTPYYPNGVGKCVRGHFAYRAGFSPSCNFDSENDSPMGCFPNKPIYQSKKQCEDDGSKWWSISMNKTECLSKMGCKTLETNSDNLPFNFRFNEMDEQLCTGCFRSNNQWTQMFSWTEGHWIPGVFIENLNWIENNTFKSFSHPMKTFNHRSFFDSLMNSVDTLTADLLRSETFCRMERTQSNLNSISCSCSGGSNCFTESIPLVGQTKPCFGQSSTFNFDYGEIIFQSESIKQGCPILLVSQYSKEIFTSTAPESLPSNFVSYQVPEKYGVLNDKDAIVGILIGDGIYIKSQFSTINKFTICSIIPENKRSTSKFPVYDFASLKSTSNDDGGPNDDGELYILDVETFNKTGNDGSFMICSNFSGFDPKSSVQTFFPIIRVDGEWNDVSKQVFDKTTRGLLFTLATLYLLVGLWAMFQLGVVIFNQIRLSKFNFQLVNGLTFIVTIFILMRSLYFYILPNGHLAGNPTGDYILVILPTFIYFTAFTVIIVLWYVIVFLVLKKNRSAESLSKTVCKLILYINIIIYLLFIACCLVFTNTQSNPTNDCGSRIIIPAKSSIPQKAISITYAVIQALISIILGAAFVYLGRSLFFVMRNTRKALGESSINSSHHNRIFLLTLICSIGFILHCVFILVLVSGHSSIAFSFIGLIITEIVPALTILYCYDPFKKIQN
ncbi:hypothetical protein RB653_003706 [Dictyostelium firmibasis]|uniref:THH1/TOM1/TOM3 domain-containing protein n=1 Tax=Dictyostelium firmibasis TaxID=79012 RepID=A0AAN7UHY7_9MYCE